MKLTKITAGRDDIGLRQGKQVVLISRRDYIKIKRAIRESNILHYAESDEVIEI